MDGSSTNDNIFGNADVEAQSQQEKKDFSLNVKILNMLCYRQILPLTI